MRFRREKFDALERIKEEFKQWKKDQKIKEYELIEHELIEHEDDFPWYCYAILGGFITGSIILFIVSLFLF